MPKHALVVALALMVGACGGGSSLGVQGPQSAQSVAEGSGDFPGMQKCPESGPYDNYLKAEQSVAPDLYATDMKYWDDLKAAGANDAYIDVYSDSTAGCGEFASTNPTGKLAVVFAMRFKDSTSASASFNSMQGHFQFSDSALTNLKSLGATVRQGAASGLGDNSTTISFDAMGLSLYVALWQSRSFELAVAVNDLPPSSGATVVTKVNGRLH